MGYPKKKNELAKVDNPCWHIRDDLATILELQDCLGNIFMVSEGNLGVREQGNFGWLCLLQTMGAGRRLQVATRLRVGVAR